MNWLWSVLDQMLKAVKFLWPSNIPSAKLLAQSELDAACTVLFCHKQFVFLFLGSSFNKCNSFSYGSGIVLNHADKCSQFLKYSVLKRSGQMCSAAFITLVVYSVLKWLLSSPGERQLMKDSLPLWRAIYPPMPGAECTGFVFEWYIAVSKWLMCCLNLCWWMIESVY